MNNKTISQFAFAVAAFAGLAMAVFGFAESFSQNALQEWDGLLSVYLVGGVIGYCFLTADAFNRNELVRILWLFKIQWGYVYLWMVIAFAAVRITNVSQLYWPHLISTGAIVLGSGILPLYLKKWWRGSAYMAWGLALFYFYQTFANGLHTIAWGEMALTAVAIVITWVIINEQIRK